jgi:hypothetical protein
MPHNSQPTPSKHAKKNVFNYTLWSMEQPLMSKQTEVTEHYNEFMELAKPLFTLYLLENKECDMLFWHGFHPDNHLLFLH